jgi:hypothetical protein
MKHHNTLLRDADKLRVNQRFPANSPADVRPNLYGVD